VADDLKGIMDSINEVLGGRWSKKELSRGKWFEIKDAWSKRTLKYLLEQYKGAGWSVLRRVELSTDGRKVFLVIAHPRHFVIEYFTGQN
jgi:hypothetical protein|tara:strand:- start:93 stop:359 length:267 start_codon:yes stop_codon:yes gene_type:complete